jgi:hypothetical protein
MCLSLLISSNLQNLFGLINTLSIKILNFIKIRPPLLSPVLNFRFKIDSVDLLSKKERCYILVLQNASKRSQMRLFAQSNTSQSQ